MKTIFKNSKNFKRIRNYVTKWNLYLYFLISGENILMADVSITQGVCLVIYIFFGFFLGKVFFFRYCAKFHHCRICVTDFNVGPFWSLYPWAAPKSPILNTVKNCKRVMQFFFSTVAACNLNKKGLHKRFFPVKFVKLFRTVFNIATFGKWFCIFQAFMRFYRCLYVILL